MGVSKTRYEVILAGSGGQGLILAGIMLGDAAMCEGKVVAQTQSYGISTRGGFSMAEVVIDDQEIFYQQVQRPDIVLALTEQSLDRYASQAKEGVPVLYDTTLVKTREGENLYGIPFTQIASEMGNIASVNVLALGAILAKVPMVRRESMEQVLGKRFRGSALELNLRVLEAGAGLISRP